VRSVSVACCPGASAVIGRNLRSTSGSERRDAINTVTSGKGVPLGQPALVTGMNSA
jgi:hypothetical protein